MTNGFYQEYTMHASTLPMMCIGELCWRRAYNVNDVGHTTKLLVIDPELQKAKLVECGGGFIPK